MKISPRWLLIAIPICLFLVGIPLVKLGIAALLRPVLEAPHLIKATEEAFYVTLLVQALVSTLPYLIPATIVAIIWCVIEYRRRRTPAYSARRLGLATALASILTLLTLVIGGPYLSYRLSQSSHEATPSTRAY